MNFKCKVVYDFQSIEFDYEVNNEVDKNNMFGLYKDLLEGLKQLGDEIPNPNKNAKKQPIKEDMASPGQIKYLSGLGFPEEEAKKLTKKEACQKIKELS